MDAVVRFGSRFQAICIPAFAVLSVSTPSAGQVFDPDVHGTGISMGDYLRHVPGGGQPSGPSYGFSMGKYEITNGQFASFLNDAQLDGGATGRGSNMVFEDDGQVRASAGGPSLFRGAPGTGARINYDPGAPLGLRYTVPTINGADQSAHPAALVSWLGAVKFANWLTLDQGLGESQRVYTEGPNTEDWHPMSIGTADWQVRDLNAMERQSLVDNFQGFRLPMDDQSQTASAYNEFYKAAAWNPSAEVNRAYGFGRDTIDVQDANYSLDDPFVLPRNPFHEGAADLDWTNPVGFFDGSLQQKADWNWSSSLTEFQTRANENPFDIFDLSGNLWEFQQDQSPASALFVSVRGGHWGQDEQGVMATSGSQTTFDISGTLDGFRIIQVPEPSTGALVFLGILLFGRRKKRMPRSG